jgi:adenylate cyclase
MPGVEILAQFIEGILEGGLVTRPSWIIGAEILSALLAGVLLMAVAPFGRPRLIIAAGALIAVAAAMSWYGFLRWQLAIDPVLPTAVIALVGVAAIPLHRPKRAQLRDAEC